MDEPDRALCIRVCTQCADACERAARYCGERGSGYDDRGRVATLIHAAAVAQTLADQLRDETALIEPAAEAFVEISRRAAALCAEFDEAELAEAGRRSAAASECLQRVLAGHAAER
jgi:hypothetical protein